MSKHAKAGGLLWRSTSFLLAVLVEASMYEHVRTPLTSATWLQIAHANQSHKHKKNQKEMKAKPQGKRAKVQNHLNLPHT